MLVPFMQKHSPIRRGGIIDSTQRFLELRDEVHESATVLEVKAMPAGFWGRINAITRLFLLHLVSDPRRSDAVVRDLIHRARTMPLEEWEAMVCDVAGRH